MEALSSTPLIRMKYAPAPADDTLMLHFCYTGNNWRAVYTTELLIENLLQTTRTGKYDRGSFARNGTRGIMYMHGPDASKMLETIRPLIRSCRFLNCEEARLIMRRRGQPVLKKRISIES